MPGPGDRAMIEAAARKRRKATVPYAIGSGSPGGRGISKTLSVIDTSM
jgi:hypothetical protein